MKNSLWGGRSLCALLTDILYPHRCPVCDGVLFLNPERELRYGKEQESLWLHKACRGKLRFIGEHYCMRCGKLLLQKEKEYCRDCSGRSFHFERNTAILVYDEAARNAMLRFKYRGRQQYAVFFTEELLKRRGRLLRRLPVQLVIPVPIHRSRLRTRGYNQAELLAAGLARELGLPLRCDYLQRKGRTEAQKKLDPRARIRNLEGALAVPRPDPSVKCVLLVDDIYTTGATLEACSRVLRASGAETVFCVTICAGTDT